MNLNGHYKAVVVDNNDPESRRRVRVSIKGLTDGIPKDYLPWAKPVALTPGLKGGSDIQPMKGAKVWVFFNEGDINDANYFGGVIEEKGDLPSSKKDGRFILYQSPNDSITITVDENAGDIEIKTKSYNTTLGTIIDKFLAHTHLATSVGSPTSPVAGGTPPITALDFNRGSL